MSPDANMVHATAATGAVAPEGRSQRHPLMLSYLDHSLAGSPGSVAVGDGGREQSLMRQHLNEVRSLGWHWCMPMISPKRTRRRITTPVAWSWSWSCYYIEKMDTDPERPRGREEVKACLAAFCQKATFELPATPVHNIADASVMTAFVGFCIRSPNGGWVLRVFSSAKVEGVTRGVCISLVG